MTIQDVALAAQQAGFAGDALVDIISVSGAETGGTYSAEATDDTRRYTVKLPAANQRGYVWQDPETGEELPAYVDPEYSVGPVQIDLIVHEDISEADARDYGKALAYAFTLAQGGTTFAAWSTFTSHAYLNYLAAARAAALALAPVAAPSAPEEAYSVLPHEVNADAIGDLKLTVGALQMDAEGRSYIGKVSGPATLIVEVPEGCDFIGAQVVRPVASDTGATEHG